MMPWLVKPATLPREQKIALTLSHQVPDAAGEETTLFRANKQERSARK
jgi:hypothetical protein